MGGDDMTTYLEAFKNGESKEYTPTTKLLSTGVEALAPVEVPAEDRNRTSPFPFGGHRFEFRAVGSAQNVSMVNTVLCTTFAESFAMMSDAIEAGKKPTAVAAEFLKEHWKVIFNGNGYSEEWPIEAGKRGVWRIVSGVESMKRMSDPKNVALFEKMSVMNQKEMDARTIVMYEHYAGYVEIEAGTMVDMMKQHVIPAVKNSEGLEALVPELEAACSTVEKGLHDMHA